VNAYLIGFASCAAIVGFWLYAIERGLRLAAEYKAQIFHRDFLLLQAAHEDALDELDHHVEAITANSKMRHPANSLRLVMGEGA
jgi:hypothetical protein